MKKRLAAEWEPALGVMVAWPLHVPHELVDAFAENDLVYVLVQNEGERTAAEKYLASYVRNTENLRYLKVPRGYDGAWPRDWGPHPVFDENGHFSLGCPQYRYSTPNSTVEADSILYDPYDETFQSSMEEKGLGSDATLGKPLGTETLTPKENEAASAIAEGLGVDSFKMPICLTGGNIMSDGRGTMMSCKVLLKENELLGYGKEDFLAYAAEGLGADTYYFLSNYEDFGIQHADCLLKLVDEETLLVSRAPQDHPYYERYERIVQDEISKMRTCYGRPYRVFRIDLARFDGDTLTAYANSYMLNGRIYVPMYGIPQDEVALAQWRAAAPGWEVLGFTYDYRERPKDECLGIYETNTGWAGFDVIHCRTRTVWDPKMLYVSLERADASMVGADGIHTFVQVHDYGGVGLAAAPVVSWRVDGGAWQSVPAVATPSDEYFRVDVPVTSGTVDYYVSAKSLSGRTVTGPCVAPAGYYSIEL